MATQIPSHNTARRGSMASVWPLVMVVLLLVVAGPTALVIVVGMLPTIVAFVIDRSRKKYAPLCVTGMNFSGVIPSLLTLWFGENSFSAAIDLILDPMMLLIMYGAAAFGWLLFIAIPPVVAAFISVLRERRVAYLRGVQKRIVEEWGEEVVAAAKKKLG